MMICYKCDQEIDASRPYSQNATGYYHGRMLYSRTSCLNAAVRRLNTLAAEVARLTAGATVAIDENGAPRSYTIDELLELYIHIANDLEAAKVQNALLRAQLDAGEWRDMSGPTPNDGKPFWVRVAAEIVRFDGEPDEVFKTDEGAFICRWESGNGWQWRPAPPQE